MKMFYVRISKELCAQVLTKGFRPASSECIEGLPEGATLEGAAIVDGNLELVFQSEPEEQPLVAVVAVKPRFEARDNQLERNHQGLVRRSQWP